MNAAPSSVAAMSNASFEHLLASWLQSAGLVGHQIQSFNKFLCEKLQDIVTENSHLLVEGEKGGNLQLNFDSVYIRSPAIREADGAYHRVTPHECRIRGLSYNVAVYANVHQIYITQGGARLEKIYSEVLLCRIPCMVRCMACSYRHGDIGECQLDPGGYFIVNGNEKSVIAQEKMRTNFIFVRRTNEKTYSAEVRSLHATKTRSTSTLIVNLSSRAGLLSETMEVRLPFVEASVPIGVVFKLLGLNTLSEMCDFLKLHTTNWNSQLADLCLRCLDHSLIQASRSYLVEHLGKEGTKEATNQRRIRYIEHILSNEFLPHQGLDSSDDVLHRKAVYLSVIMIKLLKVYCGELKPDDRDNYAFKRIETTGGLFALLFRQLFRQFLKMLSLQIGRIIDNGGNIALETLLNAKKITAGMKYAVSTGNWGIQKQSSQNGVAQILTRMNFLATVSHLRRVNTPINREGKLPKPRQLSASHSGILCPVETPEGQACGLVENLALLTHTRLGSDANYITEALQRCDLIQDLYSTDSKSWKVLINGSIEGVCEDGFVLIAVLRRWRQFLVIPPDTSICIHANERSITIDTDAGCILRPLLIKNKLPHLPALMQKSCPLQLWNQMLIGGFVELIDKAEETNIRLGETHVELHPSCLLGICAGMIPFLNHNQAPRNIYEAAMTKQAIGIFSSASECRVDTVAHALHYPQLPLVQTSVHALSVCADMPGGANVIIAVLAYTGFNQEDSIIVSRDALDRGLFRSTIWKSFKDEEKGIGSDVERFGIVPSTAIGFRKADYSKLKDDGLPRLGEVMNNGDVVIGKRMQTSQLGNDKKKKSALVDHSTILCTAEAMQVSDVYISTNKDGSRIVRVRLSASRTPEIGDKFSSHHGQKGVIGIILPGVDMPFTCDGMSPDIIINPHALPGRMTVGQLIESLLGKLCCLEGKIGNGTPFNNLSPSQIGDELKKFGFQSRGCETLFNGWTGEPLEVEVCIGAVHYQRLRHCAIDKVHARSRGAVQLITRQPVEGRSRGGGLRVGEMERDCMLAHGATSVILDRLFKQSDEFECYVCRTCGLIAEHMEESQPIVVQPRIFCRGCKLEGTSHIARVQMPYSMKLLAQECGGLNVALRFRIEEKGKETVGL